MKTIRRTQMEGFDAPSITELAFKFNSVMEWVAKNSSSHKEPVVDMQALRGYVIYEIVDRVPEGYRDQLELNGMKVTCGECEKFKPTKFSYGACDYCRGDLRKADDACDRFFKEWEAGDCWLKEGEGAYGEAIHEFRCQSICYGKRPDAG